MNGCISIDRILARLDEYLNKNDYISAEKHLLYWLGESERGCDGRTELLIRNELMGLYRKLSRESEALDTVLATLKKIKDLQLEDTVGAATSFLNSATVYKAFGKPIDSISLFEKAKAIYERDLEKNDSRLAGLYNNMALTLVDLERFEEAYDLYNQAIEIIKSNDSGELEVAITYLNIASAKEAELGIADAEEEIEKYLENAKQILETHEKRDGYYAFVCEKCASVFGYYGYFLYDSELKERARRIYEGA